MWLSTKIESDTVPVVGGIHTGQVWIAWEQSRWLWPDPIQGRYEITFLFLYSMNNERHLKAAMFKKPDLSEWKKPKTKWDRCCPLPCPSKRHLPIWLSSLVIFSNFLGYSKSPGWGYRNSAGKPETLILACILLCRPVLCFSWELMCCATAANPCWEYLQLLCCPMQPSGSCS